MYLKVKVSKYLITGASGFVGSHLVRSIPDEQLKLIVRRELATKNCEQYIHSMTGADDYSQALYETDVVIHCAAIAHVMKKGVVTANDYNKVNVDVTLNLARQAAKAGVKRFVFLSSIKVNGEFTDDTPFTPDDNPNPSDDYAKSKLEAELKLMDLANESDMDVVIIRPPLIYGSGVKGNFRSLVNLAKKGLPFPLKIDHNKRSLVSINNLVDFILLCSKHDLAPGNVFLISDDRDISTTELYQLIQKSLSKPIHNFYFPKVLFEILVKVFRKKELLQRLYGSLQVDITKSKTLLDWKPVESIEQGIRQSLKVSGD